MYSRRNQHRLAAAAIREAIRAHFHPFRLEELLKLENSDNQSALYDKLDKFVAKHVRGITSTQLRKLFDLIHKAKNPIGLTMQRPQFAHMIAKQPKEEAKHIMLLADELVVIVSQNNYLFNGYAHFIESLVAFHKYQEALNTRRITPEKNEANLLRDLSTDSYRAINMDAVTTKIFHLYEDEKASETIDILQGFLRRNISGITSTQLRNIYDKFLLAENPKKLQQLRPVLAYTAARQANLESIKLIVLLIELVKKVKTDQQLQHFLKVIEVIVSLHRYEEAVVSEKINPTTLIKELEKHFKPFNFAKLMELTSTIHHDKIQDKIQELVLFKKGEGIKGSQFRRLFDKVMEAEKAKSIILLKPLLLYTAARQSNPLAQRTILFFEQLIPYLTEDNLKDYQRIMLDALAYHRYFEETYDLSTEQTIKKLTI